MNPIKVPITICSHCGRILQDVPEVFKKNPRVVVEIFPGVCPEFCEERLKMLRQMAKNLENILNKKGGEHGKNSDRI